MTPLSWTVCVHVHVGRRAERRDQTGCCWRQLRGPGRDACCEPCSGPGVHAVSYVACCKQCLLQSVTCSVAFWWTTPELPFWEQFLAQTSGTRAADLTDTWSVAAPVKCVLRLSPMRHKAQAGLITASCLRELERLVSLSQGNCSSTSAALCNVREPHATSLSSKPAQGKEGDHSSAPAASKAESKVSTDTAITTLDSKPDASAPVFPAMGDQSAALTAATPGAQQVSSAPAATPPVQWWPSACLHCPVAGSDPQSQPVIA